VSPRRPPPPSNKALEGLAKHRAAVAAAKRRDIEKAIRALRKAEAPINISTVAAKARVVRKTIYKHHDLLAVIDQYRHTPNHHEPSATGRETTIITALRRQLATQDDEIKKLRATVAQQKTTIELLYGQLDSHT